MFRMNRQQGIGLIEVMIAVLVVGLAVVALTNLQGTMLSKTANSNVREVALKLAQAKIDDLRDFQEGSSFAYADIVDDAGGNADELGAGGQTFGGYQFTLGWAVEDYTLTNTGFVAAEDGDPIDQKQVAVTVSWQGNQLNAKGEARTESVSLTHYLSPVLSDTGTSSSGGDSSSLMGAGPTISYQDLEAPDVIDIVLEDGTKRETSKPTPEVVSSGNTVMVQFDTVNFKTDPITKVTQQDFLTIHCECSKASSKADHENPIQIDWTEDSALYFEAIEPSTKAFGIPTSLSTKKGDARATALCTKCCNSHFDELDGGSTTASDRLTKHYSYDPKRWGNKRYSVSGDRKNGFTFEVINAGDRYLEACRMQRINGYYELMHDWQLVHAEIMTSDYLAEAKVEQDYQSLVVSVLQDFDSLSANYQTAPGAYAYDATQAGLNTLPQRAVYLDPTGGFTQFIARGLFVDPLEKYLQNASSVPLVGYPFYEVNTTLLSDWSLYQCSSVSDALSDCTPCGADGGEYDCGDGVRLSDSDVSGAGKSGDYYSLYYSRGKLSYLSGSQGYYRVKMRARKGNSSLTGVGPISPYDDATYVDRSIMVALGYEPEEEPDPDPVPDPDPEPDPGQQLNVGGNIHCVMADWKNKNHFNGWLKCNAVEKGASVSSSDGSTCKVTTAGDKLAANFNCNVPKTWEDGSEFLKVTADTDAVVHFGTITSDDVKGQPSDEVKAEFCVAMVIGTGPAGGTPTSCSFSSGVVIPEA